MMNETAIRNFPKVELHCHLDGSVTERALKEIIRTTDSRDSYIEIYRQLKAPAYLTNLAGYLSCFARVMPLLQTAFSLETAAYELLRQAAREQIIYIEVRFAPQLHCCGELNQTGAIKAVLAGLERAERDFGVKSRAILCMMRGGETGANQETLRCAGELRGYGIGGLDLAGNEAAYPPELYRQLFEQAHARNLPFTIHAGECKSAANVKTAVEMGAERIGHGVAIAADEAVKELCRCRGTILELCPVSNLQTGAVSSLAAYPYLQFTGEGIAATVNTDNRTVSDTSLTGEWMTLAGAFTGLNSTHLRISGIRAIEAAFLPRSEKEVLKREFLFRVEIVGGKNRCSPHPFAPPP